MTATAAQINQAQAERRYLSEPMRAVRDMIRRL
jgi:hypothetical protein